MSQSATAEEVLSPNLPSADQSWVAIFADDEDRFTDGLICQWDGGIRFPFWWTWGSEFWLLI